MNNAPTPSETVYDLVGLSVLVFDLKTESEWGEPGPPTADPDQVPRPTRPVHVHAEAAPLEVFRRRPYTPNLRYLF